MPVQILGGLVNGSAVDCLSFFRHFMADVVSASSFGYCVGALSKWAVDGEDPLVTAIGDFPKRGILVCFDPPSNDLETNQVCSGVLYRHGLGN